MEKDRYAVVYLSKIQGIASAVSQAVFIYLCKHSGKDNLCYPTIEYIAKNIRMSRDTVKRSLQELQEIGAIRIKKTKGGANIYEIIVEKVAII